MAGLDLNMLTALRALLQERNVTRASARLGLGQPATSAALNRLRAHFGDPLLIRNGNTFDLSPLAADILTMVEQALAAVADVMLHTARFDPADSGRTFSIMVADVALLTLGERLIPAMADAPDVKLDFVGLTDAAMRDLESTLRSVDALVAPRGVVTSFPAADLWTDHWVYVVGERSPFTDTPPPERLEQMTWVTSFHGAPTPVVAALESWNVRPRVRVTVPTYVALPVLLAQTTDHIAILQHRVARRLAALGGVRVLPGPVDAPEFQVALWWHPSHDQDAGHAWLRQRIADVAAAG